MTTKTLFIMLIASIILGLIVLFIINRGTKATTDHGKFIAYITSAILTIFVFCMFFGSIATLASPTCPNCDRHIGKNYCTQCGYQSFESEDSKICSVCTSPISKDSKFCGQCGNDLNNS